MILGLHHIGISVPNLERAMEFYCGVLGFAEVASAERNGDNPDSDRTMGLHKVSASMKMLKAPNAFIELWEFRSPKTEQELGGRQAYDFGLAHLCLQVQDIEYEHKRLTDAGVRFAGPPVRRGAFSAIYGRDPFGNIVELYERHDSAHAAF